MTDNQIDTIIEARNLLTNRSGDVDFSAEAIIDRIDAVLRDVPPGQRNDVDLLLGRPCAVLPKRVVMVQHIDGSREIASDLEVTPAQMRDIAAKAMQEQEPIEY